MILHPFMNLKLKGVFYSTLVCTSVCMMEILIYLDLLFEGFKTKNIWCEHKASASLQHLIIKTDWKV